MPVPLNLTCPEIEIARNLLCFETTAMRQWTPALPSGSVVSHRGKQCAAVHWPETRDATRRDARQKSMRATHNRRVCCGLRARRTVVARNVNRHKHAREHNTCMHACVVNLHLEYSHIDAYIYISHPSTDLQSTHEWGGEGTRKAQCARVCVSVICDAPCWHRVSCVELSGRRLRAVSICSSDTFYVCCVGCATKAKYVSGAVPNFHPNVDI